MYIRTYMLVYAYTLIFRLGLAGQPDLPRCRGVQRHLFGCTRPFRYKGRTWSVRLECLYQSECVMNINVSMNADHILGHVCFMGRPPLRIVTIIEKLRKQISGSALRSGHTGTSIRRIHSKSLV